MAGIPSVNPALAQPSPLVSTAPLAAGTAGADPQAAAGEPNPELIQTLMSLLTQQKPKTGGGLAATFLRSSGAFTIAPLEKSVSKVKPDDSGYWAALGYEA